MSQTLRFRTELQRKHPDLPVFIRIPGAVVAPWELTEWTTVEGSLNGHDFGRRAIKDWGKDSPDWFVEFLKPFLEAARPQARRHGRGRAAPRRHDHAGRSRKRSMAPRRRRSEIELRLRRCHAGERGADRAMRVRPRLRSADPNHKRKADRASTSRRRPRRAGPRGCEKIERARSRRGSRASCHERSARRKRPADATRTSATPPADGGHGYAAARSSARRSTQPAPARGRAAARRGHSRTVVVGQHIARLAPDFLDQQGIGGAAHADHERRAAARTPRGRSGCGRLRSAAPRRRSASAKRRPAASDGIVQQQRVAARRRAPRAAARPPPAPPARPRARRAGSPSLRRLVRARREVVGDLPAARRR